MRRLLVIISLLILSISCQARNGNIIRGNLRPPPPTSSKDMVLLKMYSDRGASFSLIRGTIVDYPRLLGVRRALGVISFNKPQLIRGVSKHTPIQLMLRVMYFNCNQDTLKRAHTIYLDKDGDVVAEQNDIDNPTAGTWNPIESDSIAKIEEKFVCHYRLIGA